MQIKKVAIIGGGTAGWLAANHLGAELSHNSLLDITVIESQDVPSIGVGEGTVPYIMNSLKRFGISEAEFLVKCDATFKQGIKFVNWLDTNIHGDNHYYHPFDVPYPKGFNVTSYMLTKGLRFDSVGIQADLCELGLSPKHKSNGDYEGVVSYAYHFNALKFAELLSNNAKRRFGIKHLIATIKSATKDEFGNVSSLVTRDNEELQFDFYVDCSGFSSILIDKTLQTPFVSKSEELIVDTALVQQVDLAANEEIRPYTTATAHSAGWIWDIPLTNRRGTGFVYSSKYMSEQEAKTQYAKYLKIPESDFNPRKIPMEVGYREFFWNKNCVALGLAQGFVEPLEATSILLTDFSAELLCRNFPRTIEDIPTLQEDFNRATRYAWDRTVDFIKLHYCISDRQDCGFWEENRDVRTWSKELTQKLQKFKLRPPIQSDFFSRFELFDDKNFQYVLYGMQYSTDLPNMNNIELEKCEQILGENPVLLDNAKRNLMPHRQWLDGLNKAMARLGR